MDDALKACTRLAEEEAARQREFQRLEALEWQRLLAKQQAWPAATWTTATSGAADANATSDGARTASATTTATTAMLAEREEDGWKPSSEDEEEKKERVYAGGSD